MENLSCMNDQELDDTFDELLQDVTLGVSSISDGAAVELNGKRISNSNVALLTALKLITISKILKHFEEEQA